MANSSQSRVEPSIRPEFERSVTQPLELDNVARPLSRWERLAANSALRRAIIVILLAVCWEAYGRWVQSPLLFPTFVDTLQALIDGIRTGVIPQRLFTTMQILVVGYAIGLIVAGVLTTLSVTTRAGSDLLATLTSMLNPLPAIALLPLALLWFGLGAPSLIFVIIHSVLWAVALNMQTGFLTVPETLRMAGRTFGLKGLGFVFGILIPAAFPSILAGLKIGWAFAWRTLIAAELVFGVSSGRGGLGWYIFENRNLLDTPAVFAGLLTVMSVGLFVESVVFRLIENRTVRRWGMLRS
jgi:NitT/TauT family transport system permease protein